MTPRASAARTPGAGPVVDIVLPVFNEAAELESSVRRLHSYLTTAFPLTWQITIVDNASTDRTAAIAQRLSDELLGVHWRHLDRKGRGHALREAWTASLSPIADRESTTRLRRKHSNGSCGPIQRALASTVDQNSGSRSSRTRSKRTAVR